MQSGKHIFPSLISVLLLSLVIIVSCLNKKEKVANDNEYSGSESCIECHPKFYELWSTSHHGLAMQPITKAFIAEKITLGQDDIFMENAHYSAVAEDSLLFIQERKENSEIKKYEVLWALGGKNVYYFLTPWEGGRLQTLPLAYNVNTKQWYNNPASAIRHFPNRTQEDEALSWTDMQYTFNTSCYSCHVSQLHNNFDLTKNTYQTHWKEVGINCETCHGPSGEHVRVCKQAKEGTVPEDLKIIMTSKFTADQHNWSCAPCHAKMTPITESYMPGDNYYNNYDLTTLENLDFYPDGRDLGENYTFTSWNMSECAISGQMHCVTCHTSSGRYRFKSDINAEANKACASCHADKAEHVHQHSHHPMAEQSPRCIDCHMPMTMFGHMNRTDHSMRPPMPSATIKFGSPNACNMCHTDKSPQWADKQVRSWHKDDYQAETLAAGSLIDEARNSQWKQIDRMFQAITSNQYGDIFTNSLIRLLINFEGDKKFPVLVAAANHASPLIRSSAVNGMLGNRSSEVKTALLKAAQDSIRLVRLAAASSLSVFPHSDFSATELALVEKVNQEYENSLVTRPDAWSAHYNLGNHYQNMGQTDKALAAYETALKVHPEAFMPLVNSSFLYSMTGNATKAEEYLKKALQLEPKNEAANLNYALLMAEINKMEESEKAFRKVLEINKANTTALYNLSVLVSKRDMQEALQLSKQAMQLAPDEPKFGYTYAFFLNQQQKSSEAVGILNSILKKQPDHFNSVYLLASIYLQSGNKAKARQVYEQALKSVGNNQQAAAQLQQAINQLAGM